MMNKLALASSAVAIALCMGPGARADQCAPPRLENTVPMEAIGDSGEVVVPITVNGVEKKFLFDTGGGSMNYILPALALKLGMFRTDNFLAMDLNGNKAYGVAGARNVRFGAVKARGSVLFQLVPDLAFDGILSAGTMTGDDLDLDFGAMRLNFFSADHCKDDVVYWPHKALAVVPVTLPDGHFELATMLDGHALKAFIDTGSPWTMVNIGWAKENLRFSPAIDAAQSSGAPKDEPDKQIYFRKYSALTFPGITIANPLVVVRPLQFGDGTGHVAPDLIIGMEVLRHLHLYYAAEEKKIYITAATSGPSALPKTVTPSANGHAWAQDAQSYSKVWDPIHRPH